MAAACRPVSLRAAPRRARKSSAARGRAGARTADCTTARRQQQCVCVERGCACRLIGGVDLAQLVSQWLGVPLHGWSGCSQGLWSCPVAPGGFCPCTPHSARRSVREEATHVGAAALSVHAGCPTVGQTQAERDAPRLGVGSAPLGPGSRAALAEQPHTPPVIGGLPGQRPGCGRSPGRWVHRVCFARPAPTKLSTTSDPRPPFKHDQVPQSPKLQP